MYVCIYSSVFRITRLLTNDISLLYIIEDTESQRKAESQNDFGHGNPPFISCGILNYLSLHINVIY